MEELSMAIDQIKPFYTAHVTVKGGRSGTAVSDDGALDLKLKSPGAAGDPEATNPEQLFAAGYAACYQSALMSVAKMQEIDASECVVDADVSLGKVEGEDAYGLAVKLTVSIPGLDAAKVQELADAAHQRCPYSRATRGNIQVDIVTA
jgi:Ohr subfamily peroxiredoxin